jgi:iron complex outermembrane recepter protein
MSEVINAQNGKRDFRRQLLTTVSALALLTAIYGSNESEAADQDADRPTVWIELGGQFEQIRTEQETYVPPFFTPQPSFTTITPEQVQKPLDYSYGTEGSISFEPEGSDWIFSAAVRYGRSNGIKHLHQATKPGQSAGPFGVFFTPSPRFADAVPKASESHAIADFQAGRDVGLGLFGRDSRSTVNLGVRFAQFHSALQATLGMDPNAVQDISKYGFPKFALPDPHVFQAKIQSTRSFRGWGPSISWDDSAPFAGNSDHAEFTIDWGINAAVLFGRQKASFQHQTIARSDPPLDNTNIDFTVYQHSPPASIRSRSVTVPNVGGFAGLSLKFPNAKVSLGYRADFFFGAIDGGIDTARKENVGFYGPFASVSVGFGG